MKSRFSKYPEELFPIANLPIVMFIISLGAGAAYATGYEVEKKVGEYAAEVKTDRNPPVIGGNHIEIQVKEAEGGSNILTSIH